MKKSSPKNLSADCRPSVGRLSAVCWPTVGRLLADCWPTVGRLLAVCQPFVSQQTADRFSPKHRLSVGRQSVNRWPTVGRQVFWGALLHNYQLNNNVSSVLILHIGWSMCLLVK